MGVHPNVNPMQGRFPKQSDNVHRRVTVCFDYDLSRDVQGTVVRDDTEEPGLMLIALDDGPIVQATECMYSYTPREARGG